MKKEVYDFLAQYIIENSLPEFAGTKKEREEQAIQFLLGQTLIQNDFEKKGNKILRNCIVKVGDKVIAFQVSNKRRNEETDAPDLKKVKFLQEVEVPVTRTEYVDV